MRIEISGECIDIPQPYLCLLSHKLGLTGAEQGFITQFIAYGGMTDDEDAERIESIRDLLGFNTSHVLEAVLDELGFSVLYLLSYAGNPANPDRIEPGTLPDDATTDDLEKLYTGDLRDAEQSIDDYLSDERTIRSVKVKLEEARRHDTKFKGSFTNLDFLETGDSNTTV